MLSDFYQRVCKTPSDINEHLETLFHYTQKCSSVVECGVRNIVSSYAFAMGLKDTPNNSYQMVDPYKSSQIDTFLKLCTDNNVNASFTEQSDLKCERSNTDLLFIDTWHVYGHLKRELEYWNSYVQKYIILHDTTVDAVYGETIRNGWDAEKQSIEHGIPVSEIQKGLWPAVEEFLESHPEWTLHERFTNNNGLTVLKRKDILPKVLVLIIASNTNEIHTEQQNIWRQYMNSHPNVDCYLLKSFPDLPTPYAFLDKNLLAIRMQETYENIYFKTQSAFRVFKPILYKYDYVFRTNTSTFLLFDRLLEHCKTLPATNICSATPNMPFENLNQFIPSGCGFLMSPDVVEKLIHTPLGVPTQQDDIGFGISMNKYGVEMRDIGDKFVRIQSLEEYEFQKESLPSLAYHIRMVHRDRNKRPTDEAKLGHLLVDRFYPQ